MCCICSGKSTNLNVCAQFLEDLIDLIFEPSTQHLISLVQNKHLDILWGCREKWNKVTRSACIQINLPNMANSTYTDVSCSTCHTHGLVCPPLCEGLQPGTSESHYGDWSLRCRHGRLPPCSRPERELLSGSEGNKQDPRSEQHQQLCTHTYRGGQEKLF